MNMTKEELLALGLTEEQVNSVLELKGKAIKSFEAESAKLKNEKDSLTAANTQLTETVNAANAEIERFKCLDVEGIQKAADEWKAKAEEAERAAKARISELEFDGVLKDKLSAHKFSSEYARKGVMEEIRAKKLPVENGSIIGLEDALKNIRETNPDAFIVEPETPPMPPPMYGGAGRQQFEKAGEGAKFPFAFQTVRPIPNESGK